MEKEKKDTSHFIYGFIIGLIIIVYSIVSMFTKLWHSFFVSIIIALLIFIVGVIISCTQYSKIVNGNITFGNLFAKGFKTAVLAALIAIAWSLLQPIIFSNMQGEIIDYVTNVMRQKGMDDSMINKTIESIKHPNYTLQIGGAIFMYAIIGAIASLIGAAVAKKNPQANNPFEQ